MVMALAPEFHGRLRDALESAFPDLDVFNEFLLGQWGKDLDSFAPRNLARRELYSRLIRAVAADGQIREFLDRVRQAQPGNQLVQTAWQRYTTESGSIDGDPFKACLLHQESALPFWNRTDLREPVRALLTGRGRRVLVVDGPARTGRSYTWEYLNHAAGFSNAQPLYLDMTRKAGASPGDIVRLIALRYKWPLDGLPIQHAQPSQWAEELGAWVGGNARDETDAVVLVFDNTSCAGLRPETKELLVFLAEKAVEVDRLRVVLLAHPEALPPNVRRMAAFDTLLPPKKTELYDFLKAYADHRGYAIDAAALTVLVNQAWDPLAAAGPIDPEDLAAAVGVAMTAMDRLAAGGPGPGPGG
jgi:hypothetical protein